MHRIDNGFSLQVVTNGQPLTEHLHNGKKYVASPWDTDYVLRATVPFNWGQRYLAVVSVDGLSVMTGKTASSKDGGYILNPGQTLDIPGFRLNNEEVAKFRFGDRRDSYAAQMDKPQNVGVISVVFFAEANNYMELMGGSQIPFGAEGCGPTSFGPKTMAGPAGHDMGTEFGDVQKHKVHVESFERGAEVARLTLEYASRANLQKAGVIGPDAPLGKVDPFPGDNKPSGPGCKPPANWRRRNRRRR
ncbi:MAG: hypothetical protein K2X93_24965 [Candidatus Obscuribacterales bacterium]|nr:hypothetical protein [Candidatus Obscuribacterales bacterium]